MQKFVIVNMTQVTFSPMNGKSVAFEHLILP